MMDINIKRDLTKIIIIKKEVVTMMATEATLIMDLPVEATIMAGTLIDLMKVVIIITSSRIIIDHERDHLFLMMTMGAKMDSKCMYITWITRLPQTKWLKDLDIVDRY